MAALVLVIFALFFRDHGDEATVGDSQVQPQAPTA
jgi:hypothetical protein